MNTIQAKDPSLAALLQQRVTLKRLLSYRRLEFYKPYAKQLAFHRVGADPGIRERLLIAGNQVGKTTCAASEVAYHVTGTYPEWWEGVRFHEAVSAWAGSETSQTTRDGVQRLLLGPPGAWGTGTIPKASIIEIKRAPHGVPDAVEKVTVQHRSGDISRLTFKTYDQGRQRWETETLNFVWFDEEPDLEIYTAGLTRTNATEGITLLTLTPLLGMSDVVKRFLIEKPLGSVVVSMELEDAEHYSAEQRARIESSYPEHEREARTKGIPVLGSGRVFPVPESMLREEAFAIPAHWPRIAGLDIGWDHPTAGAWLAWDRDTDTVHVYDVYRVRQASPIIHAAALKSKGAWIPVAWPHDALQHDKGGSCHQIAQQYRNLGVAMLPEKATHAPVDGHQKGANKDSGGYGREAGLLHLLDRMQTGRFKVFTHLNDWWEEFRLYHRKHGLVVTEGDDLMSATRYGVMMLRRAKVLPKLRQQPLMPPFRPTDQTMGVLG